MQHDKIGFYLDVSRTVQRLKQCGSRTRLDDEGDDGLLRMLWRLQKHLGESTNDANLAGLRPFSRLRLLQDDLKALHEKLDEGLGDESNPTQDTTLGRNRHRELQDLIGQFERVFREEVESRVVFISPDRPGLLEYGSRNEFLHSDADKQHDLFVGIHHQVTGQPQQVLTETWRMLDKFVGSFLPANDPNFNLVSELGTETAYRALCRMTPSVSSNL